MAKRPPIPPEQRNGRESRDDPHSDSADDRIGRDHGDPNHPGDTANIRQNTSHARNLQDR